MDEQERERNPEHHLELEMHVVAETIGCKGVDDTGDDRSGDAAGQRPGEQKSRISGERERRQQHQVVEQDRIHAGPEQRRQRGAGEQHRIGIRQRVVRRVEDVRFEQRPRIRADRVRHPRQPPDAEVRIGMVGDRRAKPAHLRIGDQHGEREKNQDDAAVAVEGSRQASRPRRPLAWELMLAGAHERTYPRTRRRRNQAVPVAEALRSIRRLPR